MSTKERYGSAVWDALQAVSYLVDPTIFVYVGVGEVAEKAGVSRPTAKKYLEMLYSEGHIKKMTAGKHSFYGLIFNVENY